MRKPTIAILFTAFACSTAFAQPPQRKFNDPGTPPFKVLKEGENPPLDAYDNFVIGPNYVPAPNARGLRASRRGLTPAAPASPSPRE